MDSVKPIIQKLTQTLKSTVNGRYAIALAGSYAKGVADKSSDIDFFMFVENPKLYEDRVSIIKGIADDNMPVYVSADFNDGAWGGSMDFFYQGIPVETTVRYIDKMDSVIADCLKGEFEIIPALWTTNGYYTYIYLSEVDFIHPIDDPYGIITSYKEKIRSYPKVLKNAIIHRFFDRSNMWLDNFHYKSAIEREDIMFTGSIVKNTVLDMVQVVFALNETYFTGDKKLEKQLSKLDYCPHKLLDNVEFLMSAPKDKEKLAEQRDILIAIRDRLQYKISEIEE
ncbi:nucleotidyltransferase domain-containing protein [Paludicola sp. MB14-C6]|uniref:nucleotidyltransferase domain-containing protein n=1 Tax=Paludihabitans sp. MB14-C6 TaxID=3070656 RepID=UPI0027DC1D96|nr:nucleotidyltransferase domain-containing protein [Paludicola sp. MB14-C6]WMJ22302.1 nucleotidyltransferase domain-containing protein [Paludicola sp. MB14-C6]